MRIALLCSLLLTGCSKTIVVNTDNVQIYGLPPTIIQAIPDFQADQIDPGIYRGQERM